MKTKKNVETPEKTDIVIEVETKLLASVLELKRLMDLVDSLDKVKFRLFDSRYQTREVTDFTEGIWKIKDVLPWRYLRTVERLMSFSGVGSGLPQEYANEELRKLFDINNNITVSDYLNERFCFDYNPREQELKEKVTEKLNSVVNLKAMV